MQAKFDRSIDSLKAIFDFLGKFFGERNLDTANRYAIEMSVEEVFTNMVKYNPEGTGEILISLNLDGARVVIGLTDFDSDPFDLTSRPPVDISRPIDERRPGGLGIHLVRKFMDDVQFAHSNRQSTITMIKNLEEPC